MIAQIFDEIEKAVDLILRFESACGVPLNVGHDKGMKGDMILLIWLKRAESLFFSSHRHNQKKSLRVRVCLSVRIRTYMPPLSILFRDVGSWDTTLDYKKKNEMGRKKAQSFSPSPDE